MSSLIGISLAIIAAILFYRVVERRHKILVGWIALALLLLGVFGIGSLYAYAQWTDRRIEAQRKRVKIIYLPPSHDTALEHKDPVAYYLSHYRPSLKEVTFRSCNTGKDTVTRVTFHPQAVTRGRSTQHDLEVAQAGAYSPNTFDTDYVLTPGTCTELTWSGSKYEPLDSVVAEAASVTVR